MLLGIVIGTIVLAGALWVVGRHEAEINLPVVIMISVGVSFLTGILSMFIGILALPVGFLLAMGAVYKFCYLGWGKAALVALLYFVGRTVVALAIG